MPKKAVKPQELSVRLQPIVSARTAAELEKLMKSWNLSIGKTIDILLMEHDALETFEDDARNAPSWEELKEVHNKFIVNLAEIKDIIKVSK